MPFLTPLEWIGTVSPPAAETASRLVESGLKAGSTGFDAAIMVTAAAVDLWVRAVSAQVDLAQESLQKARERNEERSWYRHPDTISVDGPFGRAVVGVMPWGMLAGSLPNSFWLGIWTTPLLFQRYAWPTGFPVQLASPALFDAQNWHGPWMPSQCSMSDGLHIASELFENFSHYRSDGGHAAAQVLMEPAAKATSKQVAGAEEAAPLLAALMWPWRMLLDDRSRD